MKKSIYIIGTLILSAIFAAGCSDKKDVAKEADAIEEAAAGTSEADTTHTSRENEGVKRMVEIEIEDYGTIKLELDEGQAPITVENFITLAKDGFYDGLTFHRIMKDFMMQGGDPLGNGTGGAAHNIKGEFSKNGVENTLSHTRGAISMARSREMDSASSQFFIVHQDSLFLDKEYAVFGYVTEGMEIVDEICNNAAPIDGNGTITFEEQPVITAVRVIDEE